MDASGDSLSANLRWFICLQTLHTYWYIELNPATTHLTGPNTSLKIENLNTATGFTQLHPNDRQRHTYLQGEHLYSALELSLSGFTILNCAGWGTVDYREKYFPGSLSPLLPRHLLQLTNSIGGSELFFFSRHPPSDGGSGYREPLLDHARKHGRANAHTFTSHFSQECVRDRRLVEHLDILEQWGNSGYCLSVHVVSSPWITVGLRNHPANRELVFFQHSTTIRQRTSLSRLILFIPTYLPLNWSLCDI